MESMKTKLFLLMFILMKGTLTASLAQNSNSIKTTQEILMSYKWIPIDMYEEEDNETCFLTYTKTQEIDSTTTDEGELEVYVVPYYLSDTMDPVFDKNKVRKATTGKYMIMNVSDAPEVVTVTFELVELSEKKMVMKNLTPWVDAYTKTITYLSSPK